MAANPEYFDESTGAGNDAPPKKPTPAPIIAANIPEPMRERRQWVVWKYEWNGRKWTKVPHIAGSVGRASTTSPSTWRDFETCMNHYVAGKCDGVGFVFEEGDGLAGIDLDHCFDGQDFKPEA